MNDLPSSYANALFSLCKGIEEKQAYAEMLKAIAETLRQEQDFKIFLSSPDFSSEEKIAVLQKSLQNSVKLPHLIPFMATVIDYHRVSIFQSIVDAYASLVNDELGVLEGYIYSSSKLSASQITSIQEGFYKKLGKKVILKNILDPSLLGGVRVALDGKVYDSSLKGRLEQLRLHLKTGGTSI